MHDDGRVQGGVTVWRRGGVDGRPGTVNALIHVLKMGWRKTAAAVSGTCATVHVLSLLNQFVLPTRHRGQLD